MLRRHTHCRIGERSFARLQWTRRLPAHWEYYASNFLGFAQLA